MDRTKRAFAAGLIAISLASCAHDPPPRRTSDPVTTSGTTATAVPSPTTATAQLGTTNTPAANETACSGPDSCVLVSVGCGAVTAVSRAHARSAAARYERMASVASCGPMPAPPAVDPVCMTTGCAAQPVPHPEVRRCILDADCTTIDWGCQWTPVARRDETLARELMPVGPGCPSIMPAPPETVCIGTFCTFASNVVR